MLNNKDILNVLKEIEVDLTRHYERPKECGVYITKFPDGKVVDTYVVINCDGYLVGWELHKFNTDSNEIADEFYDNCFWVKRKTAPSNEGSLEPDRTGMYTIKHYDGRIERSAVVIIDDDFHVLKSNDNFAPITASMYKGCLWFLESD